MDPTPNMKICSKQVSPDCVKMATPDQFRSKTRRECKNCHKHKMKLYYEAHKEDMKASIRSANNKRYQKKKPISEVLNAPSEAPEV